MEVRLLAHEVRATRAFAISHVSATAEPADATNAVVRKVSPDEVCMMNNRFMKEKQIPVEAEGRKCVCRRRRADDFAEGEGEDVAEVHIRSP